VLALSLVAAVEVSILVTGADAYADAHRLTAKTGRPMVVLVGNDSCPEMKSILPQLRRRGLLAKVAFAVVNMDQQRTLGRQLTGGGPIPQLVIYRRTPSGWKRRKLVVVGQSPGLLEAFIRQGVGASNVSRMAATQSNNRKLGKR